MSDRFLRVAYQHGAGGIAQVGIGFLAQDLVAAGVDREHAPAVTVLAQEALGARIVLRRIGGSADQGNRARREQRLRQALASATHLERPVTSIDTEDTGDTEVFIDKLCRAVIAFEPSVSSVSSVVQLFAPFGGLCEKRRSKMDSASRFFIISIEPPAIIQPRERRTQYSTSVSSV